MAQSTGIDFVINVDIAGTMTQVGGQRGATLDISADTTDRTTKDSNGWKEYGTSFKEWSIEADGLLVESDSGWKALLSAMFNNETIQVEMLTADGARYYGDAIITNLPIEAPHDDEATYSVTLQGTGALNEGTVTP